jgi:hypothetical protein
MAPWRGQQSTRHLDSRKGVRRTSIVPSRTGGQAKPPFSSHFVARTIPEPSKTSSFKRSDRFGSEDINVTAVGLAA